MRIYRVQNAFICLIAAIAMFAAMMPVHGYAGENPDEAIVASGDDFIITQKEVDAYGIYFARMKWSREEVARVALKYELLSREYRQHNKDQAVTGNSGEDSTGVAAKIRDGKKYAQKVLDDWRVSSAVVESYYRSNPEKYRIGEAPDGTIAVKPLDAEMINEIRFKIIEGKKDVIVKEFVDSLISKYHIQYSDLVKFN